MKVLLVNDVCWNGGVETQMAALASGLARKGHEVSVFFYTEGPGAHLFDGVCKTQSGQRTSLGEHICVFEPNVISTNMSTVPLGFVRTIKRIGYTGGIAATCHGSVFHGWPPTDESCALVAVSGHVASLVRSSLGIEARVIYNGIDLDVFSPNGPAEPSDSPVLLWVGRSDDPNKDFPAFAAVATEFALHEWKIWIVDGAINPSTNTLAEWFGDRCRVFRNVSPVRMAEIYRGVGASGGHMVSTSQSEAFGLAVVEAMSCGCPVAVPSVGGLREVVLPEVTGLVYDRDGGFNTLGKAIRSLSGDETHARMVGQARARVSERFTLEQMVQGYEDLFNRLADNRRLLRWRRKYVSRALLAALRMGRSISK